MSPAPASVGPVGWQPGHAAAVLLFDPPAAPLLRAALLEALLDSGAAVLELDAYTARGFSAESDRDAPAPMPESLLHDLAGALVALRRDSGAGLVVALGHGLGGEAALLAADGARMAEMLGDAGPRFTALGAIGPGAPAFRAGASPPPDEGWASRVPLLCNVLAVAHLGTPAPGESGSVAAGAVDSACRLGLLVAR